MDCTYFYNSFLYVISLVLSVRIITKTNCNIIKIFYSNKFHVLTFIPSYSNNNLVFCPYLHCHRGRLGSHILQPRKVKGLIHNQWLSPFSLSLSLIHPSQRSPPVYMIQNTEPPINRKRGQACSIVVLENCNAAGLTPFVLLAVNT